eukprot:8383-Heterococcus_DN1.PRE.1
MPHHAAGCRILPPVSVPNEPSTEPAATAAAEPPEEPPGACCRLRGLRVVWYALVSVVELQQ